MFELAILPTLLYNAETWVGIDMKTEERLENLQLFFLRLALRVPASTPKLALRSETGMRSMKARIWMKKLMFVHHMSQLKAGVLAKQVWEEQVKEGWPGLAAETRDICSILGIEDVNVTSSTRI